MLGLLRIAPLHPDTPSTVYHSTFATDVHNFFISSSSPTLRFLHWLPKTAKIRFHQNTDPKTKTHPTDCTRRYSSNPTLHTILYNTVFRLHYITSRWQPCHSANKLKLSVNFLLWTLWKCVFVFNVLFRKSQILFFFFFSTANLMAPAPQWVIEWNFGHDLGIVIKLQMVLTLGEQLCECISYSGGYGEWSPEKIIKKKKKKKFP